MPHARVFLLLALVLVPAVSAQGFKQVAAPPEDFLSGRLRLEVPSERSHTALLPVPLADNGRAWAAELEVPFEGGDLALALLADAPGAWDVTIVAPSGRTVDLAREAVRAGSGPDELMALWVERLDIADAPAGSWRVSLGTARAGERAPQAWLLVSGRADLVLESGLSTLQLTSDAEIAVRARLSGPARVQEAEVVLESAAGVARLALRDDGTQQDDAAGDGIYGAWLPRWTSGNVRARVAVRAETQGRPFLRSHGLAFFVHERPLLLEGSARTEVRDEPSLEIFLEAFVLRPERKLLVAAEVWGTGADGTLLPVCWLARMQAPASPSEPLRLALDARWLARAGAGEPLELRRVRVQDPDTLALLDSRARLELPAGGLPAAAHGPAPAVTGSMLSSSAAPRGPAAPAAPSVSRALMLSHGYCSGGNIWPAAHFSPPKLVFLDPNANRTNDQFALLMLQQGSALDSFGVVAHSQGGLAALHLLTYYESPLDHAVGGRRIQSLASPYQGTPLASLGAFACGTNQDLTPNGATTWLAGIPTWARAEVYFWTTQDGGSTCHLLTSFFLTPPHDGTVEKARGQLPGGNSMGHVAGWCHTTGMSWPAGYTDAARNAQMNAAAAR